MVVGTRLAATVATGSRALSAFLAVLRLGFGILLATLLVLLAAFHLCILLAALLVLLLLATFLLVFLHVVVLRLHTGGETHHGHDHGAQYYFFHNYAVLVFDEFILLRLQS